MKLIGSVQFSNNSAGFYIAPAVTVIKRL